jgi:DNA-binding beta-propeller fold protein YncE
MVKTELVVTLGEHLYAVERPWGQLPDGLRLQYVSDLALDSQGHVYVAQRGDPPVVVFDADGDYVRAWGSGVIADAHGICITSDDLVWLVDRDAHQLVACDTLGRPQLTIGERHRPRLGAPFNHPTDVAVGPNGDLYVADGYGNSAVHRFTADGVWQQTWGTPGAGPGQFTTPHAVRVMADGRVLVADRENNRVEVFSAGGAYLTEWGDLYHPMDIYIDADGLVYVTDQIPRLSVFTPDGQPVGRCRPVLYGAHGIWGDGDGSLYLAEAAPMDRVTKLTRLP